VELVELPGGGEPFLPPGFLSPATAMLVMPGAVHAIAVAAAPTWAARRTNTRRETGGSPVETLRSSSCILASLTGCRRSVGRR
jgi:hypothetical protein